MMEGVVYRYTNILNNMSYIGRTTNPRKRKQQHKYAALIELKSCDFYDAIRKYGWNNFKYEELEKVDTDLLNEREMYWIDYYDTYNNGYNQNTGGMGQDNFHHSEETKRLLSVMQKGKPSHNKGKHFRPRTQEEKDNVSKRVLQFTLDGDFVREWDSTAECGRNGYNQGHVAACCRGVENTHKGYFFKYKEINQDMNG